jgi:hypothetical protein
VNYDDAYDIALECLENDEALPVDAYIILSRYSPEILTLFE